MRPRPWNARLAVVIARKSSRSAAVGWAIRTLPRPAKVPWTPWDSPSPTAGSSVPTRSPTACCSRRWRDRDLVRAPAGAPARRGDGDVGDGVELRDPPSQREDDDRAAADPSEEREFGGPVLDPALRPGPRRHALGRRDRRAGGRRRDRPQHGLPGAQGLQDRCGRRADQGPRHGGGGGAGGGRGQRPAGDGQAALGPAAGGDRRLRAGPRLVDEAGVAAIGFHPRSAAVHHKGTPDYDLAAKLVAVARRAGDPHRRPARPRVGVLAAYDTHRATAVMLARGSLGNPWLFEQVLGLREDGHARGGHGRARLAHRTARSSIWATSGRHAGCARPTRGTCRGLGHGKELNEALQRTSSTLRRRSILVGTMPRPRYAREVILTAEGLEKLKEELELSSRARSAARVAERSRSARVRRHLRELRVRRRQNEQAMLESRIAQLEEKLRPPRHRRQGRVDRRRQRRDDRPRQGREDRQVAEVHDRRLLRGQPGPELKLLPTSRRSAARCWAQRTRSSRCRCPRARPQAQDHQDRRRPLGSAARWADETTDLLATRRASSTRCARPGIDPSRTATRGSSPSRTIHAAHADLPDGEDTEATYRVAGRLAARRGPGQDGFSTSSTLVDRSGRLQLQAKLDVLGEGAMERTAVARPRRPDRRRRHRRSARAAASCRCGSTTTRCWPSRCGRRPTSTTACRTSRPGCASASST